MNKDEILQAFLAERNAFLAGPVPPIAEIRAFFSKWNPDSPQVTRDISALAGYYKARLGWVKCPDAAKREAVNWLKMRGFSLET